jgi:hypothetical protein
MKVNTHRNADGCTIRIAFKNVGIGLRHRATSLSYPRKKRRVESVLDGISCAALQQRHHLHPLISCVRECNGYILPPHAHTHIRAYISGRTERTHLCVACDDDAVLLVSPRPLVYIFVHVIEVALPTLPRCASLHDTRYEAPIDAILSKLFNLLDGRNKCEHAEGSQRSE